MIWLNFGHWIDFFLYRTCFSKTKIARPWYRANDTDERNANARAAYESLMTITLRKPDSEEYREFSTEVKRRAKDKYGESIYGEEEASLQRDTSSDQS